MPCSHRPTMCFVDAKRLAYAALNQALRHLEGGGGEAEQAEKTKKTKKTEKTRKSQSEAALMALRNVAYDGFSNSEIIDTRIMKHFRAYHNAGAMVNIHISRLHKDGGRLEQRIMEHYRKKKEGYTYIIVRVR